MSLNNYTSGHQVSTSAWGLGEVMVRNDKFSVGTRKRAVSLLEKVATIVTTSVELVLT